MACALALAVIAVAVPTAGPVGAADVTTQPNFVVIMSDDQGPGMMRALPTVERQIARRGTSFTDAIASYPLCCPARATFRTGDYAHNHGAKGNNVLSGGGYQALLEPDRTLPAWLRANGYATGFVGKWLNGVRTPRKSSLTKSQVPCSCCRSQWRGVCHERIQDLRRCLGWTYAK